MLDIGGVVGALIVKVDDAMEGSELPIEFAEEPHRDIHTGVWRRAMAGDTVVVAVFPELLEGRYRIHAGTHHDGVKVHITGGQISELDLRRHRRDRPLAPDLS